MARHPCCRALLKIFSAITMSVGLISLGFGIYGAVVSHNAFWSNIGSNIFLIGSAFLIGKLTLRIRKFLINLINL